VFVNQTNLNGKLRKNWGGKQRAKQISGRGMAHPGPPLESPLVQIKVTVTNRDFGPDYKLH